MARPPRHPVTGSVPRRRLQVPGVPGEAKGHALSRPPVFKRRAQRSPTTAPAEIERACAGGPEVHTCHCTDTLEAIFSRFHGQQAMPPRSRSSPRASAALSWTRWCGTCLTRGFVLSLGPRASRRIGVFGPSLSARDACPWSVAATSATAPSAGPCSPTTPPSSLHGASHRPPWQGPGQSRPFRAPWAPGGRCPWTYRCA